MSVGGNTWYTILGEMRCGKIVINGPVVRIMGQESLKAPAPRIIRGRRPLFHRDSLQQQGPLLCLASCYTFIIIHSIYGGGGIVDLFSSICIHSVYRKVWA